MLIPSIFSPPTFTTPSSLWMMLQLQTLSLLTMIFLPHPGDRVLVAMSHKDAAASHIPQHLPLQLLLHLPPRTHTSLARPLFEGFLAFWLEKPNHSPISFSNIFSSCNRKIKENQNSEMHSLFEHFRRPHHTSLFLFRCLPTEGKFCTGQPQLQMLEDLSCLPALNWFLSRAEGKYKVITGQ